ELLSLASKLAALHVQYLNDPVVQSAVTDIEALAGGLSNKIWQKIMILDVMVSPSCTAARPVRRQTAPRRGIARGSAPRFRRSRRRTPEPANHGVGSRTARSQASAACELG
ncbi:MAG: hypothetical protein ACO1SX_01295, partial [Actinomycetota bacterium]